MNKLMTALLRHVLSAMQDSLHQCLALYHYQQQEDSRLSGHQHGWFGVGLIWSCFSFSAVMKGEPGSFVDQ